MNGVLETAVHVQAFCDSRGWRSCFIGGIAVQRWGEPRVTRDVHLSLLAGFGREDGYIDALMEAYTARIGNAREFALTRRVLLLQSKDGVGIDISLAAIPFEQGVVARASTFDFGAGLAIRTCSAEDLVVLKLFASRPLDIRDAEGVAVRQGDRLTGTISRTNWHRSPRRRRSRRSCKSTPSCAVASVPSRPQRLEGCGGEMDGMLKRS